MTEADQATQMILRTLALVALAFWAVATTLYGLGDLANGISEVHSFRAASYGDGSTRDYSNQILGISMLSGVGLLFGTVVGLVGSVLGAIQVALAQRGATWTIGFSVLGVGGVVAAAVISQLRNDSDGLATDYVNWTTLGALAFPLIATVVFVGAWVSVRPPAQASPLSPAR